MVNAAPRGDGNVHVKASELMVLSLSKSYPYRDTYPLPLGITEGE